MKSLEKLKAGKTVSLDEIIGELLKKKTKGD